MNQEDNKKKLQDENKKIYKEIAPYLNLGLQLAVTIGGCVLLGWWLDRKFDMTPALTLIFTSFGFFAGFYNFFKAISKNKSDE